MSSNPQGKIILALSLPQAFLIIMASCVGLFVPGTYSKETLNWTAQSLGQDAVDLFLISPLLIVASIFAARRNRVAMLLWAGVLLFLIYTYVIYCFDVHFNNLFIVYCFTLGLAFYSFLYFLFSQIKEPVADWFDTTLPVKSIGAYLMAIPCLFYFLWLSQIIPAILNNTVPKDVVEVGLPTNPIHVIDLSVFLPGLFIVSVLFLKKKPLGLLLAPVMLVFTILMDITIGVLVVVMKQKGIDSDYTVTVVMSVLALISMVLLILYLKSMKSVSQK